MRRRRLIFGAALLTILTAASALAVHAIDEPLRRHMEQQLNASLTGYRVHIGDLRLHLAGGSLDLLDSTIAQTANPEPPVARIPRLHASVHWRALLHGALVGDFWLDRPVLNIDVRQAGAEVRDKLPIQQRGWQEAAQHIYPLKIDLFRVTEGDVTYSPARPFAPLRLALVNIRADNIRNVRSRDRTYPSDLHLDAFVFDSAELRVDGQADFLAQPHAGVRAYVSSQQLPLWYLTPLISRYASIQKGTLSIDGTVECGPRIAMADLDQLTLEGMEAWYVRTSENAAEEQRGTERAIEAARHASNNPTVQLRAARMRVLRSTLGVANETADPRYALFLTGADLSVRDFTNQRAEGPSRAELRGNFMGSGKTLVRTTFRPRSGRPDFDADIEIEGVDLTSMNDLLRASEGFDVAGGELSLYSELSARDASVQGYVKPIFKDLQIYAPEKDDDKPFLDRMRLRIIGGVAGLLKNQRRDEIATRTDVSGPLAAPRTSTLQAVLGMIRNAYFVEIPPGLEKDQEQPAR
ncbi:MAG TPA: DUF748 domain-containing protein [Verrucomicrobiae bacterium]|nr:DUF748 domain-containing protein [Verrucomicrobiae bacterium]